MVRPKSFIINHKSKILLVVGPTSSGKSELAVKLAKVFNGEIISCDSRQIYKGMNLGTGKVAGKWSASKTRTYAFNQQFVYKGVAHHLIDFLNPKRQYSASLFQRNAKKTIGDILKRGHLPILCGGTAHWIDAVVFNQTFPDVKPNLKLREHLQKQPTGVLFHRLIKLDPVRAKNIDKFNKNRLIRALEIVITTGKPVPSITPHPSTLTPYSALWLGIKLPQSSLYKKIDLRLKQRIKAGMLNEVERLHSQGLSWKKLESFGLEYKYISLCLQKKLSYDQMFSQLSYAIKHYSKRQMTWWKRNKEIVWLSSAGSAVRLVERFLKK